MLRAKRIWQWMRSMAAGVWQHAIRLMSKLSSLLTKAKSRQPDELIVPLGVLIGTVAFGLWWQSFAASLLALIVLCFLAGLYKTNQQLLAALRKSESVPQFGNANSRPFSGPTQANSAAVNEAIRSLKPWVANEVSLTEENAKECCAVLVDSLAPKARAATAASST